MDLFIVEYISKTALKQQLMGPGKSFWKYLVKFVFKEKEIVAVVVLREVPLSKKCLHIGALSAPFNLCQMPETGIEFQKWDVL